jgi:hypothetical protein
MKLSDIMPFSDWVKVQGIATDYGGNPLLMAAIGWYETHWGRLGWGKEGYHLGYSCVSETQADPKYQGMENQVIAACWQIRRDLKLPLTLDSLIAFARESWKPGNPLSWASGVWGILIGLQNDYTGLLPAPEPVEALPAAPGEGQVATGLSGLLLAIAGKLEDIVGILREGGKENGV